MFHINLPVYLVVLAVTGCIVAYMLWKFYDKNLRKGGTRARTVGGGRRRMGNAAAVRRPAARMRADSEMHLNRRQVPDAATDSREHSEPEEEVQLSFKKKVGTKKAAKLAEKERRKEEREAEERFRENQRKLEEQEFQKRKREEEELDRQAAAAEAAKVKRLQEEAARELAEYEALRGQFTVEDVADSPRNDTKMEAEILEAIEKSKVISVEHLAVNLGIKIEECVEKLRSLLSSSRLSGVLDDRGKFVQITNEEYESVAKFIEQRGRVTLTELMQNEQKLIKTHIPLTCQ